MKPLAISILAYKASVNIQLNPHLHIVSIQQINVRWPFNNVISHHDHKYAASAEYNRIFCYTEDKENHNTIHPLTGYPFSNTVSIAYGQFDQGNQIQYQIGAPTKKKQQTFFFYDMPSIDTQLIEEHIDTFLTAIK